MTRVKLCAAIAGVWMIFSFASCGDGTPPNPPPPDAGTDAGIGASDGGELYWCSDTAKIFRQYCAPCHGSSLAAGVPPNFRLHIYANDADAGVSGAFTMKDRIKARALATPPSMPPFGNPGPTEAEKVLMDTWISTGAKFDSNPALTTTCADGGR